MKRSWMILGLAALAVAAFAAQAKFRYTDAQNNLEVVAPGGGAYRVLTGGAFQLTLSGGSGRVAATSKSQGLRFESPRMVATVARDGASTRRRIQSAQATGGVEIAKTGVQGGASQSTEIQAAAATYSAGATEGKLDLDGPVTIRNVDEGKRQTLLATGTGGSATFDPEAKGRDSGVRTATLGGPVKITVVQAPASPGEAPPQFVATGAKLVFNNAAQPATLTLSGDVKIVGSGEGAFELSGVERVILTLNERGEMTAFEVPSGSGPVTAKIPTGKGRP